MNRNILICLLSSCLLGWSSLAGAGTTLDAIRASGILTCGVDTEEPEYSTQDAHGNHAALDSDICKAVALAVLGPNAKVSLLPFRDEEESLAALEGGRIALLATASPTLQTSGKSRVGFARPVFYDYQGLLVNHSAGISSPRDLAGKKVCFLGGTEIESRLEGYMKSEKIAWLPYSFQEEGEMEAAFITGGCAAISADVSQLAYERIGFKRLRQDYLILADVIAKDPLAPAYRLDDPQWAAIVDWTVEALIQAEESGVGQKNLAEMKLSEDPLTKRLLGTQQGYWQSIDLDDGWVARVIFSVGNYGELFERDLGSGSPMRLARGANNLWTHGGLMYALPIR